ncbi:MAG: 3-hydroxyacyl-CoA dehydrogenase family protein, partial [Deltaproteobacteria bacterium]|nr:3-hydroxyacyl-CoA dehydrogenase family protein [Deltaproteobacteria bacterium]
HGFKVSIFDAQAKVLHSVPDRIHKNMEVFLKLGKVKKSEIDECIGNIDLCDKLASVCKDVDFIIEAIEENLSAKLKVFEELEQNIDSNVIISSNTSAISITRLSEGLKQRHRFLGTHFWNPPHIIPCVEVIRGENTADTVFETVFNLMRAVGKEPVKVLKDIPGFLGNRLQHAMWREAISLAEKGIASPEDIDKVVKYGFGLRLPFIGPLETADLAGLDLSYDIHKYLFPFLENSSEPSQKLKKLVDEGLLGVKTGRGFYDWPQEKTTSVISKRDQLLLKIINMFLSQDSTPDR